MCWFRKWKKSRKPSKQSDPVDTATRPHDPGAKLDPGIDLEGSNDRGGVLPLRPDGSAWDQQLHASMITALTPGDGDGVAALQGPGSVREVTLNSQNEQVEENVPTLHSAARESEAQAQREHGERRTVPQKSGGSTPETADTVNETAERFGPLKTILRVISVNYADDEGPIDIGNKIDCLLPRIVGLEGRFNFPPCDAAEQKRQDELIRELGRIEGQLRSLGEGPGRYAGEVSGLLEGLRGAIFDYQVALRKEIHDQQQEDMNPAEAAILDNFCSAKGAEYRHDNRNGCLRGTRVAILDGIELWTRDFDKPPIYWLNGLAGTGKTAIAQTVAERLFADGRLGASFFCSRDFEDRSDPKLVFPTLATQLARKYAEFRSIFIPLVQRDPEIAQDSLYNQMNKLIAQPLQESGVSTVIILDALDECGDEETASAILSVLGRLVSKIPKVKFFVTGRPEPRVQTGFRLPLLAKTTDVFILHNVEPGLINNDIQLFLRHSFLESSGRRGGLDGWPTKEDIDHLCEQSAGLFVYAMATIRFIDYKANDPKRQLELLLRPPDNTKRGGKAKLNLKTTLDMLYTSILRQAFGDDDPENDRKFRSILGAIVLAVNPLSPSAIATLLDFDATDVSHRLSSTHSLLMLDVDVDRPVRAFHKSFPEFIIDPARCANPRFRICPPAQHVELLAGCLELMNRRLERNMFQLPDGVTNSEVDGLRDGIEGHIDQALGYACRSWHKHLVDDIPAQVASTLHQFLEEKFLFWLEVLSVLGALREAVDALEATAKCKLPDASPTLDLVRDCSRFVIEFFEVIDVSAPHIYHSALPLSSQTSIVRDLYKQYARPLARVVRGLPLSWEPAVASVHLDGFHGKTVWSPCNKFFAVVRDQSVEVLDAVTLNRFNTFEGINGRMNQGISFSPDSRLLTLFGNGEFISWDLQTGGLLGAAPSVLDGPESGPPSFAYSKDGNVVAVGYGDKYTNSDDKFDTFIYTYDFPSRTFTGPSLASKDTLIHPIWTHDEHLRFATIDQASITIWEVGFGLTDPPEEVESLPVPDEIVDAGEFLFLPALSRLAFTARDAIYVWDAKTSQLLLSARFRSAWSPGPVKKPVIAPCSFSSDGRFFACWHDDGEVYVWKKSPASYVLHQQIPFPSSPYVHEPRLSPNGESIVTSLPQMLHLSHTRDQILPPPNVPTCPRDQNDFILGFSPDEKFAAFGQEWRNMVTILDLQSGEPRWTADMGVKMECLGMTKNTVVVVGEGKIVTWNIPGEARSSNTSTDDSIRITVFDHPLPSGHPGEHHAISLSPDLTLVAVIKKSNPADNYCLEIYDMSTGTRLASTASDYSTWPRFTRDGREVRVLSENFVVGSGWEIVRDSESGSVELKPREKTARPSGMFSWQSPDGYKVTHDGWVLNPDQKRLLWLPHRWRSDEGHRTWSGQFLGLSQEPLSELVILQFFE